MTRFLLSIIIIFFIAQGINAQNINDDGSKDNKPSVGFTLSDIVTYPNPMVTQTTISFVSQMEQTISFEVYNALGNAVYNSYMEVEQGENEFVFYRNSTTPKGLYIYILRDARGRNVTKKLLIE